MEAAALSLEIAEMLHKASTGNPNCTVRGIALSLRKGSLRAAQLEWQNDGDKVSGHPNLEKAVSSILGCRIHLKLECDAWICKRIQEFKRGLNFSS